MPSSPYTAIPTVLRLLGHVQPATVLDVGIGFGKYGLMLRELAYSRWPLRLEGIEGHASYVGPAQLAIYDQIYISDAMATLQAYPTDAFELVLAMDVVEHFRKEDALRFIEECRRVSSRLFLMSTTRRFSRQEPVDGNELERHLCSVSLRELRRMGAGFLADRWAIIAAFRKRDLSLHWSVRPSRSELTSALKLLVYSLRDWIGIRSGI